MRDDPDDPTRSPDLAAAGAALREEWRAEQETAGRDAAEQWRHGRSLAEVAAEWMHRGDRVAVVLGGHRFMGVVVEAATDLLSLHTVAGRVDVHLCDTVPLMTQVAERAPTGGRTADEPGGSFRARLLAREAEGAEMTVGTTISAEPYDGRIVVGRDHVCMVGRGGGETFLSLPAIAYVMPRQS